MKRQLVFIFVIFMILLLLPVFVHAEIVDSGVCGDHLTWTLDDNGVLSIDGTGKMTSFPWYENSASITSVNLSNDLESIIDSAFLSCKKLEYINLPDNISSIGKGAFRFETKVYANLDTKTAMALSISDISFRNPGMKYSWIYEFEDNEISGLTVTWVDSDAEKIHIPDRVTGIKFIDDSVIYLINRKNDVAKALKKFQDPEYPGVFIHWNPDNGILEFDSVEENVTSVTVPDEVTSLGNNSGRNAWKSAEVVILPGTIKDIPDSEFEYCTNLSQVILSNGTETIGTSAFSGCENLEKLVLPETVKSIGKVAFWKCSSLTSVTVPNGVTDISNQLFSGCTNLKTVTLPDSITYIGSYAFSECISLTDINIPRNVTHIDSYAFYHCTSLTKITIPGEVYAIGNSAFYFCTSLKNVMIPANVRSIGDEAFGGCPNLILEVECSTTAQAWAKRNNIKYICEVHLQEEVIPAVLPTYLKTGQTEGKYCSSCGDTIAEPETIQPLAHEGNLPEHILSVSYISEEQELPLTYDELMHFSGEVTIIYSNGDVYSGDVASGLKSGEGKYSWSENEYYQGSFKEDDLNGVGKYYYELDNHTYELHGTFSDGVLKGEGTLYRDDNKYLIIPVPGKSSADFILPTEVIRIEEEAFANIKNVSIYLHPNVEWIAENAFDSSITIFCEKDSYAEKRCTELGLFVFTY